MTTPPSRGRRMNSDKQRAMVASSAEDALPTSQIRDRYGISESTLYRIPQRNGIPLRGRMGGSKEAVPPRDGVTGARRLVREAQETQQSSRRL